GLRAKLPAEAERRQRGDSPTHHLGRRSLGREGGEPRPHAFVALRSAPHLRAGPLRACLQRHPVPVIGVAESPYAGGPARTRASIASFVPRNPWTVSSHQVAPAPAYSRAIEVRPGDV